ncbi:MAG TPA: universal stress protein [Bacteroidales bacterium]|nr:universal stress protein [Bacteroidales bacterium]
MKKLLIPTDFSEKSINTALYGIDLAEVLQKEVVLVNVIDLSRYTANYQETTGVAPYLPDIRDLRNASEKQFEELMAVIEKKTGKSKQIGTVIETGIFADKIIDMSEAEDTYMIILTGRSEHNFLDRFISDMNQEIVEDARCPVFIVPPEAKFTGIQKIIYATNYHEADIGSLAKLSELAEIFDAHINALHITRDDNFKNQIRERGFKNLVREKSGYTHIDITSVKGDSIIEDIDKFAHETKSDLISIMKENRGFLEDLFTSSSTRKLIMHTKLPVLVFHEKSFIKKE